MIKLGKKQKLTVISINELGVYINSKSETVGEPILLSKAQIPPDLVIGSEIEVFVYTNAEGEAVATTKKPQLQLGEMAIMNVNEITSAGAYLDWGLDADLFLPIREQTAQIKANGKYLVALYIDTASGRLCATMKVYSMLSVKSPYKERDRVTGIVYDLSSEWGYFVAVDNKYHGLIYYKEISGTVAVGDTVRARVKKIRPDGRLELSLRELAYKEIEVDSQKIMEALKLNNGRLELNDNSSPALIKSEMKISKSAFKRAVGRLYKEGAIKMTDTGIELSWK